MSSHLSLRVAADSIEPNIAYGLNTFADQVAVAMKRSTSPQTGSKREPQPIVTAPKDGRFVILKEDASGKFNIARFAPEVSGWVRENDEPIKIIPSCWYPIQEQNNSPQRLDVVFTREQAESPTAPQSQLAPDIIAGSPVGTCPETDAAVEPERASSARNRFAALSIVSSLVLATCAGMYFRPEITSYMTRHSIRGDLFGINQFSGISRFSGQVVEQATQWLSRNLQNSAAQLSQGKNTQPVEASSLHLAVLHSEVENVPAFSATTPAKAATLVEPAAPTVSSTSSAEHDGGETVANELAMTRREIETKAALLSKAAEEAAQLRQAAETAAAELRQSLAQERDRVAALARELASARGGLETEVALSRKASEEAEQLRQSAKTITAQLEEERNTSAAMARDPEAAQGLTTGARPMTDRPAVRQGEPINEVTEQAVPEPAPPAIKDTLEAARLMARARALVAQGNIAAARLVLERAAETGSAEASFALAETYDPIVLSKWGTSGTRGETTKARELYTKAQAGGVQEANDRINALHQ
jgi:hypothetical protein